MSTTFEHDIVTGAEAPSGVVSQLDVAHSHHLPVVAQIGARPVMPDRRINRTVVLVAPEFLGAADEIERVRTTLRSARGEVRALVCVRGAGGLTLAAHLTEAGLPVDVLLASDIEPGDDWPPHLSAAAVRMPSGSTPEEMNDFALALSDIVMTGPDRLADPDLISKAEDQRKPVIPAGDALPALPVRHPDIAGWLHTGKRGWRILLCHASGRLEQFCLELSAFNWRGREEGGRKDSRERLLRCVSVGWKKNWPPYFASEQPHDDERNWRKLAPDNKARDDTALIVERFNSLDHSALYGAFFHRDLIWVAYFLSAFAVFDAVMGSLKYFAGGVGWPSAELVTLAGIVVIIAFLRATQLQDHWTSCRLAAEQLRIVRLCLPLFVVPSVLRSADKASPGTPIYTMRALEEVKRTVRDQGIPRLRKDFSLAGAAAWLELIVADQASYHETNERRLERAEYRLHDWAAGLFLLAVLAVGTHYFHEVRWIAAVVPYLLILTAAGPAAAAALHGVRTRLGIVHRIALSRDTRLELAQIQEGLAKLKLNLANLPPERAWQEIRALALLASNAMWLENTSWHNLVRREKDDIM
ncbi:MAG TPA: hypothetical protein VHX39_36085 [Acetobacteraceae bacterium]|nr:hypothetical protein [Acetobacteraceae bacterium]